MPDSVQSKSPSKSESHKTLRLAKVILLLVGIGSCLASVTGSVARWPITAWPMYSKYAEPFPSSFTSINELRVIANTGNIYKFSYEDLLTMEGDSVIKKLIEQAIEDTNKSQQNIARIILVNLIEKNLLGREIKTIQIWRLTWKVEPLALPPLAREHPYQEVMIDSFDASLDKESSNKN